MIKHQTILNIADNSGIRKISALSFVRFFKIFVIQKTKDIYRPFLFKTNHFASGTTSAGKSVKFRFNSSVDLRSTGGMTELDRGEGISISPFSEPSIMSLRLSTRLT